MANSIDYACSNCGIDQEPEMLVAKKVMFQEIGVKPRTFRSRIVAWLCPQCTARDADWNKPPYESPGFKGDTSNARARR